MRSRDFSYLVTKTICVLSVGDPPPPFKDSRLEEDKEFFKNHVAGDNRAGPSLGMSGFRTNRLHSTCTVPWRKLTFAHCSLEFILLFLLLSHVSSMVLLGGKWSRHK